LRRFAAAAAVPLRKTLKTAAATLLLLMLLLAVIEGFASYALILRNFSSGENAPAKKQYTTYDAELGWVNKRNLYIADVYGPGIYVRTDARGFRQDSDVAAAVPKGKVRLVCSGDSFTYGYGVDNAHTWCALLRSLNPRIEAVNIATDGYGVDQAYLRFKRDAANLEFQVHLFAFITDDFYRILNDSFLGYAKPVLKLQNGALVEQNVPVPTRGFRSEWLQPLMMHLRTLSTVQIVNRAMVKIGLKRREIRKPANREERDEKAQTLLRAIFSEVKRIDDERSSRSVLVYLPTIWELDGGSAPGQEWSPPRQWAVFLDREAKRLGIPMVNLFSDFASLPRNQMVDMFIPPEKLPFPEGAFHLSENGNAMVANVIYRQLTRDPAIGCLLSRAPGGAVAIQPRACSQNP
jgi:hypothetical protein